MEPEEFWETAKPWTKHTVIWYDYMVERKVATTGLITRSMRTDQQNSHIWIEQIDGGSGYVQVYFTRIYDVF